MTSDYTTNRRGFLGSTAVTAAALACGTARIQRASAADGEVIRARRPVAPFRVWFQPRQFQRDVDLYANMTIDASGWLDPRLAELAGKTSLDWVYGLNHPYASWPEYWRDACSVESRSRQSGGSQFVSAGIAIDEWVPPQLPDNVRWLSEGLREGRRANPDVFIAVWVTDPTAPLIELARDGTVDLVIVEGYTHSTTPGLTTSWDGILRRCGALATAELTEKTILCFGHITDRPDSRGGHLDPAWLESRAEEIKRRHPEMPGVAFFQSTDPETKPLRRLVQSCDRLSGELWPDEEPPTDARPS